ncbi:MAG: hypothetical protein QXY76_06350 [Nitrososphaeria archaeon]
MVILLIGILTIPIIPVTKSIQVPYPMQTLSPYMVTYTTTIPMEVSVKYNYNAESHEVFNILDWELALTCTIENVDNVGGTFTVTAYFYDKGDLVYNASDRKYIGPGQTVTFDIQSKGLAWSTDWKQRYSVKYSVDAPTKIESKVVVTTSTTYTPTVTTTYITEQRTEYVSIIMLLLGMTK